MKFVALVSGGKDSIFSIMESQRQGHELVACVHLGKPSPKVSYSNNSDDEEEESYMYQTAGSEVVQVIVKECLQVPLILHVRTGTSVNTSLVYQQQNHSDDSDADRGNNAETAAAGTTPTVVDEVEDLYQALLRAKQEYPEIQAVSSGAILSTYQRVRIENVCQRLGLVSLSFLWRRASQQQVLHEMIHQAHIYAVLVRTAAPPGLVPRKHLNHSIRDLESHFETLYTKYQFHVCGEGGEYETLCLDCPIYKKRLVLDKVKIHEPEHDGVGVLQILACHAEDKNDSSTINGDNLNSNAPTIRVDETSTVRSVSSPSKAPEQDDTLATASSSTSVSLPRLCFYPHVRRMRAGLWHVSDIVSPGIHHSSNNNSEEQETSLAVQEALEVFGILDTTLRRYSCTPQDVVYVHLYLSQMSHFAAINPHFQKFFGVLLPPSRSCVAIPTTFSGRRVQMDCLVQCGSGEYMRRQAASPSSSYSSEHVNPCTRAALSTTSAIYRNVLHVQSRSHWAPVCVGPYSQANTLYSAIHVLAGQIGLEPATMTLRATWGEQLQQVWTNIASVLDALDNGSSSLSNNILSGLVYVSDKVHRVNPAACLATIHETSNHQIQCNGGVVPGAVDNVALPTTAASRSSFGGYEDEETMLELMSEQEKEDYLKSTASTFSASRNNNNKSVCPLLVVSIPDMPVGALVEVEVVAATSKATSCLSMDDYSVTLDIDEATARRGIVWNNTTQGWDAGHDFDDQQHNAETVVPTSSSSSACRIDLWARSLGKGCTAYCLVTATAPTSSSSSTGISNCVDAALVIHNMVTALSRSLHEGPSCLRLTSLLHVRFYYVLDVDDSGQDYHAGVDLSAEIRLSLHQALSIAAATDCEENTTTPAISVVPVYSMSMLDMSSSSSLSSKDQTSVRDGIFMAMQATLIEPIALETELWIRHGRE